jgi:hypothetical protein
MNERIRELSDIAYKNHLARNPNSSFGRRYDYDKEFAELIVRECARLAIEKQTENDVSGIVSKNPAKDFAYALVEHFGVEE